jgi:exonuclease III
MRLLAWNIRQGGGSRLARIADALARHEADILVLSEYRGGESATRLLEVLNTRGYAYVTALAPPPRFNGVLVAARCPFLEHDGMGSGLPEPYRILSVEFAGFRLVGIYMPNLLAKIPYWEALIAALKGRAGEHALAMGDFNTCRPYLDEAGAVD